MHEDAAKLMKLYQEGKLSLSRVYELLEGGIKEEQVVAPVEQLQEPEQVQKITFGQAFMNWLRG